MRLPYYSNISCLVFMPSRMFVFQAKSYETECNLMKSCNVSAILTLGSLYLFVWVSATLFE